MQQLQRPTCFLCHSSLCRCALTQLAGLQALCQRAHLIAQDELCLCKWAATIAVPSSGTGMLQRPAPWEQQISSLAQQAPSLWEQPAPQAFPPNFSAPSPAQPGMRESFGEHAVFAPLAQGRHMKRSSSVGLASTPQPGSSPVPQQPAHMHRKGSFDFGLRRLPPAASPDPRPPPRLAPKIANPFDDDATALASQPQVLPVDGMSAEAVQALFQAADWDHDGLLAGPEAVAVFQRTGLSERQLKRVSCPAEAGHSGCTCLCHLLAAQDLTPLSSQSRDCSPAAGSLWPPGKHTLGPTQVHCLRAS